MAAPLQINLKKISAEKASLHCIRPDGTETWSRVHPFYPTHDLTHFAVENVLGLRQGFFGLILGGWELSEFIQKSVAQKLPTEAFWAECAVGVTELLGANAAAAAGSRSGVTTPSGSPFIPAPSLAAWSDALAQSLAGQQLPPFRTVYEDEYRRMNLLRADLLRMWAALPVGATLSLGFALPED